ncbi:MAG: hypothetical protein AAB152_13665 [Candidatus Coatesbacteria bacterium]
MPQFRVYVDTSVIGGCLDEEFAGPSRQLLDWARDGKIMLLVSDVVIDELAEAPGPVRAIFAGLPIESVERVPVDDRVRSLRDAYLSAGIIGPASAYDATHVAAASVAAADAICSWNFRHIVRLDRIRAYNEVNVRNGYGTLTIMSPREVNLDEPADG